MEDRYLRYVLEVAREQNMTRAAKKLYLTQPSLSQYISRLEDELGTPLFQRSQGRLSLTEAGKRYVAFAEQVLTMQEKLLKEIEQLKSIRRLNIASTSSWSLKILSAILPQFTVQYPQIEITSQTSDLKHIEAGLQAGQIDLALTALNYFDPHSGHGILLGMEEILFAVPASHPFCSSAQGQKKVLGWEEWIDIFDGDQFILPEQGSSVRNAITPLLEQCQKSNFHCLMNHMETVWDMVAAGSGIAFLPYTHAHKSPLIRFYSLEPVIQRYDTLLCRKGLEQDPAVQTFIKLTQDCDFLNLSK